ncbi:uncharacterized protein [Primulina eburnea]|uniref:uncharacterized protein n=1 Tax=Primulina eburnea TaxID=1245227 RepID=UPI003C6C844A
MGDFNDLLSSEDKRGGAEHPAWLYRGFREVVDDCSLQDLPLEGYPFTWERCVVNTDLVSKLCYCAGKLDAWGRTRVQYKDLKNKLSDLYIRQEGYWQQRAKAYWLRDGDSNTRYFHAAASMKKKNNTSTKLRDDNGTYHEDIDEICGVVQNYFHSLFASSTGTYDPVINSVNRCISEEENNMTTAPFTEDEFRKACFQMHPDKSPGPDGFNPTFFQKFWQVIGPDIVFASCQWLENMAFPSSLNDTNVVLIPKDDQPESMKDFRPISLCNVLKNKGRIGDVAIKIDISKAYDRVDWKYLRLILLKLGFSDKLKSGVHQQSLSLLFADDSMFFFRSTIQETNAMKIILATYEQASGQVTKTWDNELIEELFSSRDVTEIKNIPLTFNESPDMHVWHFNKDEKYSVQYAYRVLMERLIPQHNLKIPGSWSRLWQLKIPPKVKMFLWQACRQCLPTRSKLNSRGIFVPLSCVICDRDIEHTWHTFIVCKYVRECWAHDGILNLMDTFSNTSESFSDFVFKVLSMSNETIVGKIAMILWSVWKQRNNKLWNDSILPATQATTSGYAFLCEWSEAKARSQFNAQNQNPQTGVLNENGEVQWKLPPPTFVKCNVDVASLRIRYI